MKRHARKAYTALKKMGAPVIDGDGGYGPHFRISGEKNYTGGWAVAGEMDDFGVSLKINKVLEANGLFVEWINPGVLGVYDG